VDNLPLLGGGRGVGLRAVQQGKPTPNPSQEGNRNPEPNSMGIWP
jgi:hypothetical protein